MRGDGTRELKTWDAAQLKAFLEATREERLSPLWHLYAMTGLRRGEALGLRWEDVDLEQGRLAVRRALIPNGAVVVVSEPKTARGRRTVALDPETVEALKRQAAQQLEDQTRAKKWTDTGLVFTKDDGEAGTREVITRFFQQAVTRQLPRIRLHDLRHTHATPGAAGRHPPQGRLRAAWARDHLDHARHLLARDPGDAGGGGGADRGAGAGGGIDSRQRRRWFGSHLVSARLRLYSAVLRGDFHPASREIKREHRST